MSKTYDLVCPKCGYVNRNVQLDMTVKWMICRECRHTFRVHYNDYDHGYLGYLAANA